MIMWLSVLSEFIPDAFKNAPWLLWDRKTFWLACRSVYGRNFQKAYEAVRLHESTRQLIMQCYKVTK